MKLLSGMEEPAAGVPGFVVLEGHRSQSVHEQQTTSPSMPRAEVGDPAGGDVVERL